MGLDCREADKSHASGTRRAFRTVTSRGLRHENLSGGQGVSVHPPRVVSMTVIHQVARSLG
jgi:hypothetical protein